MSPSTSRWSWAHTDRAARLFALVLMTGGAGWLATSSLQQDFAAYYTAGRAVAGGLDPYLNHVATTNLATTNLATTMPGGPVWDGVGIYRHSRFLYAPLIAHLFRPLAALPYEWAKAIFTTLSLAALWAALALVVPPSPSRDAVGAGREPGSAPGFLRSPWVLGLLWSPVFLTLERGQIDLLLLAALAAAWRWRARAAVAGGLLAVVVMVKPAAVGVLPVLVAARRGRWALATLGGLVVLLGLNLVVAGRPTTTAFLTEVLPRAGRFGEGGPAEWLLPDEALASRAEDLEAGRARLGGRIYAQEEGTFRRNASLPRLLADGETPPLALVGVIAVILLGAAAWAARRAPHRPYGYWGGLVAGVLTAPVSWAMGLVWALPVLALIVLRLPLALRQRHARGLPSRAARLCFVAFIAAVVGPWVASAWIMAGAAVIAAAVVASTGGDDQDTHDEVVA